MDSVEVKVAVWDRGQERVAIVQVPVADFLQHSWRTTAALAAAVELGIPFTLAARGKLGLLPEDKQRLVALCKQQEEAQ